MCSVLGRRQETEKLRFIYIGFYEVLIGFLATRITGLQFETHPHDVNPRARVFRQTKFPMRRLLFSRPLPPVRLVISISSVVTDTLS
jgi:hypothetical protein